MAATERLELRLSPEELADIDRVSGAQKRSEWLRDLARAMVLARDAFDGPCAVRLCAVPMAECPELDGSAVWADIEASRKLRVVARDE
jgi:hypothetical protein